MCFVQAFDGKHHSSMSVDNLTLKDSFIVHNTHASFLAAQLSHWFQDWKLVLSTENCLFVARAPITVIRGCCLLMCVPCLTLRTVGTEYKYSYWDFLDEIWASKRQRS